MAQKSIPFRFILDYLVPLEVTVKPMFGLWAIYVNEKIVFALREREDYPDTNGVWVATTSEHHESLKTELPSLRSISPFGRVKETEWQILPLDADDFEASVMKACDLIKHHDQRIGRIPVPRKVKTKK
jgi:hypothetical protein